MHETPPCRGDYNYSTSFLKKKASVTISGLRWYCYIKELHLFIYPGQDLETIPGTLGVRWECIMDGMLVYSRPPHTPHTFTPRGSIVYPIQCFWEVWGNRRSWWKPIQKTVKTQERQDWIANPGAVMKRHADPIVVILYKNPVEEVSNPRALSSRPLTLCSVGSCPSCKSLDLQSDLKLSINEQM